MSSVESGGAGTVPPKNLCVPGRDRRRFRVRCGQLRTGRRSRRGPGPLGLTENEDQSMASSPKAPADPIDARLVRKLADILTETGLSEIEVEHSGLKIRVAKTLASSAVVHTA